MKIIWVIGKEKIYFYGLVELWESSLPNYVKEYFNGDNFGRIDLTENSYVWRIA